MAAEEHQANDPLPPNHAQPPAPAVATGAAPATLPQYPELIMNAIDALNDKNGSNKSAISKHIETTYGNLPPAHTTLLSHHLNKMKATGQLLFVKNNYLRPGPDAPPRRGRGRGRPPKPKKPLAPGTVLPPPRPRGRPPKSRDPNDPPPPPKPKAAASPAASGRKRGRPPKATKTGVPRPSTAVGATSGVPRGRGRPPKVKQAVTAPVGA